MRLKAQREILTAEKALVPLVKDLITYWKQVEAIDGRQGVSLDMAPRQEQREVELTVEKDQYAGNYGSHEAQGACSEWNLNSV